MARFRFRLEALLTARRHAERSRQQALAVIDRERRDLEETIRRHQSFISAGKRALGESLTGELDIAALRGHAASTLSVMRRAERLVLELAGVHRRLEAARAELTEAARRRRAVELLRERRYAEWLREQSRLEDRALDEAAAARAARREETFT